MKEDLKPHQRHLLSCYRADVRYLMRYRETENALRSLSLLREAETRFGVRRESLQSLLAGTGMSREEKVAFGLRAKAALSPTPPPAPEEA